MKRDALLERLKTMKIGVLSGGLSNEREVSLQSGEAVMESLKRLGVNAVGIDMDRDISHKVKVEKIDLAFIALHGRYGEDGCVQGALDIMGVPYTGSGVTPSAVAMDKAFTKIIAKDCGAMTPIYRLITKADYVEGLVEGLDLKAPVVVKPAGSGSSLGVTICRENGEIGQAIETAFESGERVIVEEYIDGTLATVGIVGNRVLPVIEVETGSGFYDYKHKYSPGDTVYHIPARLDKTILHKLSETTLKIHGALGIRGMSRSEFIVEENGDQWFLEINTIPGLTKTSLLPKAAHKAGMSFDDLVLSVIEEAWPG